MNYADLVQRIKSSESDDLAIKELTDWLNGFQYTAGLDIGEKHDQATVVVGCKHFANSRLHIVFAEDLTASKGKVQVVEQPDYAYPTVQDYEEIVGFKVNDAFKMAWAMARTTNDLFLQMADSMEKNHG